MRSWVRDVWEALGRPPWYVWPLLIVPLLLSSYFLTCAVGLIALGITFFAIGETVWGVVLLAFATFCVFLEIAESKGW